MKREKQLIGTMNELNRPKVENANGAYEHIFAAIVDQRLLPGTKLTELALMEALGVSRRIVAAALQRLTWEKLVVLLPNRGAFISAPNADEAREVFAARMAIEAGTTEAVARAADPACIVQLRKNVEEEHKLREMGRIREAIHLSGGFHLLMAELSGNRILAEQVRVLVARTSLIVNLFDNQIGLAGWHDHHDDLIEHCAKGEVEQAVSLMRSHIAELEQGLALDRRRPVAFDMISVFGTS